MWARPCQLLPDLTFTSLFYLLREGTSGSEPGKQTGSCHCTCPRRRRRNTLLTKGRIFRAAFPPIKAACLIPSKLKIKGRLFLSCQPIKLQAKRRTSLFSQGQVEDSLFHFPATGGAVDRLKGCPVSGWCHLDPRPSRESGSYSKKNSAGPNCCLTEDLLKPLSFTSSTWRTGSWHSFYSLITKA